MTLHRAFGVLLVPLGALAAVAWSRAVLMSALLANLYVDGYSEATTLEVLGAVGPFVIEFLVPGVVVVGLSRRFHLPSGRWAFGLGASIGLPILTSGYGLGAIAASALPWLVASLIRKQRLSWPPVDLVVMVAGILLIVFWCYSEAHR